MSSVTPDYDELVRKDRADGAAVGSVGALPPGLGPDGLDRQASAGTALAPKLREDLILAPADAANAVVVKDPLRERFFRFGPVEAALLPQLDGRRSLATVARDLEPTLGQRVPEQTLAGFVAQLDACGLLDGAYPDVVEAGKPGRKLRGQIFYLRFALHNPETLLIRLHGRLGFLFRPLALWSMAWLVLLALYIALGSFDILARDLARAATVSSLPFIWLVILLATIVHEYAHGLTCTHFGGRVREMGFMLIFLQPALYCNVSDAWLFPKRAQRLMVTLAGPLADLVLWALAVLLWRISAPEAVINQIALILIATSAIGAAINLIPLIKLDGYYLLSDLTGIANLRAKSFAYVARKLRHPFQTGDENMPYFQRRVLFWYGLLGALFTLCLLGSILYFAFHYLTEQFQAFGFVAAMVLVGLVVRRPVQRRLESLRAYLWPVGVRRK